MQQPVRLSTHVRIRDCVMLLEAIYAAFVGRKPDIRPPAELLGETTPQLSLLASTDFLSSFLHSALRAFDHLPYLSVL